MNQTCPRCGFELQPVDNAPPPFCAQCGLPQLRVSPDAQAYPASPQEALAAEVTGEIRKARSGTDWPVALKWIGIATLLGVVPPSVVPGALSTGTVGGPALLLTPLLTMAVVSLYHRGRPRRPINGSIGARMGALLGLSMGALIALVTGVAGFVLRYGYHSHTIDDTLQAATVELQRRMAEQGPVPPEIAGFFQSPEFHAGSLLAGHAFYVVLLVIAGSICGWIAGAMLRARRQRHIG